MYEDNDSPGYDTDPKPVGWNHDQFRDSIVEAVRKHDIPYSKLPDSINLQGNIGGICDRALDTTLADPQGPEYGTYGKVSTEGKLQIASKLTRGKKDSVTISREFRVESDPFAPQYATRDYSALDIHTHGHIDLPPSPVDVSALLSTTEDGGAQSSIVVTTENRYILMRSLKTPDLDEQSRSKFVAEYKGRISRAMRQEADNYARHFKSINIPISEDMLRNHIQDISTQRKVQMGVLKEVCKENSIGLYVGRANNQFQRKA